MVLLQVGELTIVDWQNQKSEIRDQKSEKDGLHSDFCFLISDFANRQSSILQPRLPAS
jgi:hypothetical protein